MRITTDTRPLPKKLPKPGATWMVDDYARIQEFRFPLPMGFLALCKLWDTTPNELIADFIDNLSGGSWKREGRDQAKILLLHYAIEMNYGQHWYTRQDRVQMFAELDAIGMLWPNGAKEKMINLHTKWRDKYYFWWYKKWYSKLRRK